MQSVCLCVRYTVRGANIWTNGGVLGAYCQINTWTAAESGDSKHSSFLNIQNRIFARLVCVTVRVLCETKMHVLFSGDAPSSSTSNASLFKVRVSYVRIFWPSRLSANADSCAHTVSNMTRYDRVRVAQETRLLPQLQHFQQESDARFSDSVLLFNWIAKHFGKYVFFFFVR